MGLFNLSKPRRFRHEYMYVDERKDKLKAIEERAKSELGKGETARQEGRFQLRGKFVESTTHLRRRRERKLAGGFVLSYGVIVILLILLFAIWKMLLVA